MSDFTRPDFKIYDNGSPIPDEVVSAVIQITVDDALDAAAVATIRLRDDLCWLSNDTKFKIGNEIKVELGYVGQTQQVFIGEVTGWKGSFPRRGNQTLTVIAQDRFHRLRRNRRQKTFLEMKDSEAVSAAATAVDGITSAQCTATPIKQDCIIQWNQTDADFILERASLYGMEVYVDDAKLIMRDPKLSDAPVATLEWHKQLQHFSTSISLLRQQKEVKVTAWNMDGKVALEATAKENDERNLMAGTEPASKTIKELITEPTWFTTTPAKTQAEVDSYSKALFQKRSEQYLKGEGICDGDPTIKRGTVIELTALGDLLSGKYYARRVIHTLLSGGGYSTTFRVIRTALLKQTEPLPERQEIEPEPRPEPPALMDPDWEGPGPAEADVDGDPHTVDPAVDGSESEGRADVGGAGDTDDPADEEKEEEAKTKNLRLMFVDESQEPFKNKPFDLVVEGETISGTTSPDGRLVADVPADAKTGEVTIWTEDDKSGEPYTWPVSLS